MMQEYFPLINDTYQIGPCLSEKFTSVFIGLDLNTGERVAIKTFPSSVTLTTDLKHPFLVEALGVENLEGTTFIIMKLMKESLFEYRKRKGELSYKEIARISRKIFEGISYLHDQNSMIRDVSPLHIMMEKDNPKVAHFGVVRSLKGDADLAEHVDSMLFSPPEIFTKKLHPSSDVWNVGCVMWYLSQKPEEYKPLFYGETVPDILSTMIQVTGSPSKEDLEHILEDIEDKEIISLFTELGEKEIERPNFEKLFQPNAPKELIDLVEKILVLSPQKRIPLSEILEHTFIEEEHSENSLSKSEENSNSTTSDIEK